jgi:phosphatidylserine synthase
MERFFVILTLTTAALMVSRVEFEAMPRFDFSQPKNRIKVFFILLAAIAIMINASLMIFPFVLVYILYGVIKLLIIIFAGAKRVARRKPSEEV